MVSLTIDDGNPWWLSPNIWTVPGTDPLGPEGLPVANQPCFLWARVRNIGNQRAENATVRFYWANPAVGVTRATATLVGSSFVSIDAGATAEVLCLAPWEPSWLNQGHECVLAEVFHPLDPLPAVVDFQVPTDRHVAQRNLSVLQVMQQFFSMTMEVHNPAPVMRVLRVSVVADEGDELRSFAKLFDGMRLRAGNRGAIALCGLITDVCAGEEALDRAQERIELQVPAVGRTGVSIAGLLKGDSAFLNVTVDDGTRVVGGLGVLIVRGETVS